MAASDILFDQWNVTLVAPNEVKVEADCFKVEMRDDATGMTPSLEFTKFSQGLAVHRGETTVARLGTDGKLALTPINEGPAIRIERGGIEIGEGGGVGSAEASQPRSLLTDRMLRLSGPSVGVWPRLIVDGTGVVEVTGDGKIFVSDSSDTSDVLLWWEAGQGFRSLRALFERVDELSKRAALPPVGVSWDFWVAKTGQNVAESLAASLATKGES